MEIREISEIAPMEIPVTFLGPFQVVSDLQLGDKKVTLNQVVFGIWIWIPFGNRIGIINIVWSFVDPFLPSGEGLVD